MSNCREELRRVLKRSDNGNLRIVRRLLGGERREWRDLVFLVIRVLIFYRVFWGLKIGDCKIVGKWNDKIIILV